MNTFLVNLGRRRKDYLKRRMRALQLYAYLKKFKPDVIHCHFGEQGCTALLAASRLRIPLVVSFHGFDAFSRPKQEFWMQQYKRLFKQAAAVIVVSTYMKEQLASLGCSRAKIHIIHVGKQITDYLYKKSYVSPIRNFISIGRMVEKKGHLDTIRVFGQVAEKYPDVRLTIIGDGDLLQQAQELITQLQLQNVVRTTGGLPHTAVKKELYDADAFILCSKTGHDGDKEGIPTVLMEAQAIGLPCVSTQHSGISEVIPSENQWVLGKEGDVPGLAKIVERLISTPEAQIDQIRRLGRYKIEEEFNLEKETRKLLLLYKSITS